MYCWYVDQKQDRDLILARADGTDAHAIATDVPGGGCLASWSPDGSQIAFVKRNEAHPLGAIWTVRADGSGAAMLTDGGGACPGGIFHPNWSPDGSRLAVVCYPDTDPGGGSVATYDLATRKVTRLNTVTWPDHLDNAPSWSPDGKSLAFAILHWDPTDKFLDGSLVATISVDGGKERRLTTYDTFMSAPDWSPDGSQIVMSDYDLGNMHTSTHPSNLYLIKPDGTGLHQFTHSAVDPTMRIAAPHWTSDGSRIVVAIGSPPPGPTPSTMSSSLSMPRTWRAGSSRRRSTGRDRTCGPRPSVGPRPRATRGPPSMVLPASGPRPWPDVHPCRWPRAVRCIRTHLVGQRESHWSEMCAWCTNRPTRPACLSQMSHGAHTGILGLRPTPQVHLVARRCAARRWNDVAAISPHSLDSGHTVATDWVGDAARSRPSRKHW